MGEIHPKGNGVQSNDPFRRKERLLKTTINRYAIQGSVTVALEPSLTVSDTNELDCYPTAEASLIVKHHVSLLGY